MAYTDIDKPSDYFNTTLYTGNGGNGHTISGVGFQSDLTWLKSRSNAISHMWIDSVRGVNTVINSNTTDPETTFNCLDPWNSDGFVLSNNTNFNGDGVTFASWNWKAGTSFTNDASGTGIGSLDSTGSVNDTAGFSIVSYTGNTTAGATIKHGLSTKPDVIICKARQNSGGAIEWVVYHKGISTPQNNTLTLNSTAAKVDRTIAWNDTAPTSSVFSVGTWVGTNAQVPMIAYVFSEKQGYSKFNSYVGNGNVDGTFCYCGFKPAFILQKNTARAGSGWGVFDATRTPTNVSKGMLIASSNAVEDTSDASRVDFLSNGFKWRTTDNWFNDNGAEHIFMAFAENPFTTSTGIPATAR